ncbi:glycosyltransferase [Ornithinimicrobium sp. Y1694]|uniref:glycosyltransferase n=1 Tax=Ornithinimicrobium sp. Y1694 TaxID=3418590 RepID=UPI003CEEB7D3
MSTIDRVRQGLGARIAGASSSAARPAAPADPSLVDLRPAVLRAAGRRPTTRRVPTSSARVAVAASDAVRRGLSWEWEQTDLTPRTWEKVLRADGERPDGEQAEAEGPAAEQLEAEQLKAGEREAAQLDLVVVEVAGAGIAGWPVTVTPAELASAAQGLGVPSIAWVSAPPHDDVDLSGFDHVLDAQALPPATQPRARGGSHLPGPERLADVLILDLPVDEPAEDAGNEHADHQPADPADNADNADNEPAAKSQLAALESAGLVTHQWDATSRELREGVGTLASAYRVLLDVGRRELTDTRPVLDALADRTAVVTTPGRAQRLPEPLRQVVATGDAGDLRRQASVLARQDEYRDRATHLGLRAVLDGHTYADRASTLLRHTEAHAVPTPSRTVSVVVPTNRPHEITNVLENVARQERVETELIIVAHGLDLDHAELKAQAADLGVGELTILHADRQETLGAVLNRGLDAASGAYLAKMDDDNFYGAHFLGDLVDAFAHTSAGITGKWAHYVWLKASRTVVLRFEKYEHTYHRLVQGGSIVATRDVALDIRFSNIPRAVDSDFLNRAMAAGVQTYSGDRYNFVSIRGDDRLSHTWKVDDLIFLTGAGRVITYGDPRELVSV